MKKLAMALLLASGVVTLFLASRVVLGQGGEPAGFHFWSKTQILDMSKGLPLAPGGHNVKVDTIATAGNHRFMLVHRDGPGQAEYHATDSDVMFVETGHATLTYGGKMVDPQQTAPNEERGSGIQGGMEKQIGPGDVVTVPPKLPHQVTPLPGQSISYFVVKVTQ